MDIEAIVKKHSGSLWLHERPLRAALTELAAIHAIELRAYEATVVNQAERIRQLEAERVPEGVVNLPATDHRITVDDEGVPTIMLGCGGFVISDVYSVGLDYAGVSLELRAETKEVGMSDFTNYGKSSGESGAVLKIVATRPESLLVLIGELQEAVDGFGTLPPAAPAKEVE